MRTVCAILCLALAGQLHAGAWPREKGAVFLSFSAEFNPDKAGDPFTSVYAEYGLRDNLTLGLDAGMDGDTVYKGIVFARVPLTPPDSGLKLAAELGAGTTADRTVLRPGLMIGHGLDWGWVAMDTLATIDTRNGNVDMTTDLTLGIGMTSRTKLLLQVQSGHQLMELDYLKFAPSVVYERRPGQHLELGVLAGIENAGDYAIKLGVWRSF